MDNARRATVRPLLAVLALVLAAAAIWAATALAGSSGSEPARGNDAPALVQDENGNAGPHEDCPERGNGDTANTSSDV
jgi:hypothetical protein